MVGRSKRVRRTVLVDFPERRVRQLVGAWSWSFHGIMGEPWALVNVVRLIETISLHMAHREVPRAEESRAESTATHLADFRRSTPGQGRLGQVVRPRPWVFDDAFERWVDLRQLPHDVFAAKRDIGRAANGFRVVDIIVAWTYLPHTTTHACPEHS